MTPKRYRKFRDVLKKRQPDLTVLMENVHKPHNLAAVTRSADAVGIMEVHATAANKAIRLTQKTSGGTKKWVRFTQHTTIETGIRHLKAQGFVVLAADFTDQAVDFRDVDYTRPTALLLGSERDGVSQAAANAADGSILIPMLGMTQSLNVSVAAALILSEAQRQRQAAGFYDRCRLTPSCYNATLFEWCQPEIAAICREYEIPYPELDATGELLHPFALEMLTA